MGGAGTLKSARGLCLTGLVRHGALLDRLGSLALVVGPTLLFGRHIGLLGAGAPGAEVAPSAPLAPSAPGGLRAAPPAGQRRPALAPAPAPALAAQAPPAPAPAPAPVAAPKARLPAPAVVPAPGGAEAAEAADGHQAWIFCAGQWQECICPGTVRWGTKQKFEDIPLKASESLQKVKCAIDVLKDIAPGEDSKHCMCQITVGGPFFSALNPALLQGIEGLSAPPLVASCDLFEQGAADGDWGAQLWGAEEPFCNPGWASGPDGAEAGGKTLDAEVLRRLQQAWVDRRFAGNYARLYDASGWVARAFVNYYAGAPDGKHAAMTEELVESVHKFSSYPIVVFHFGSITPESWTPERFPRLVLIHAEPLPPGSGRSFNFNKMRAMLLARIRTGVQLDSDQFVAPGVDAIFDATEREVTKDYPMAILPAHFLDRTPRDTGRYWERYCPKGKCEFQTARWGHAHPTWTYWAAPFIGRWLRRNLRDETLPPREDGRMIAMRVMRDVPEDEDLLNVATWEEGGHKQWCKLDLPGPEDFEGLLRTEPGADKCQGCGDIMSDRRFHPNGVAKAYYTAHHAVNPSRTREYVKRLQEFRGMSGAIGYKKQLFKNGEELRRAYPGITCLI